MERILSVDERIRRAEERYYKNKTEESRYTKKENQEYTKKTNNTKTKKKIVAKLIKNTCVCLIIYGCFYNITTSNYIVSEDFTNKAKEVLNTDINLLQIYSNIKENVGNFVNNFNKTEEQQTNENTDNNIENIQNNNENIGGAEVSNVEETNTATTQEAEETNNQPTTQETETVELSQMEKDANFVKENISVIKPVNGTISSKFGPRNPTTVTVPKNHTGTDIAAVTGTKIISATDGKVILNSSQGDFGKHLEIQIGEVIFLYAHCNELYVNEGDEVVQGQEIAEVGSTGNTTGPHLHFEIRYQDRYIDPEMVLQLS